MSFSERDYSFKNINDSFLLDNVAKEIKSPKLNFSAKTIHEIKKTRAERGSIPLCAEDHSRLIRNKWKNAFHLALHSGDPWVKIDFTKIPVEKVKRYRYNALKNEWVQDIVEVRMQSKPFNAGAMRECFRLKKLSTLSESKDWNHSDNYVGKSYIQTVEREMYFTDVKLQMDAKLWGEDFSSQSCISKKVDIIQMSIIEFIDRPSKPLYHLEHFIEGTYKKYNSNSGYVDESLRNTPHAFSHYTFERSGHRLIVVDIQGVGDLWTDPQIHTAEPGHYGDGNLGLKGMALFFKSHRCNRICKALKLSEFDLFQSELDDCHSNQSMASISSATEAIPLSERKSTIKNKRCRLISENELHPQSFTDSGQFSRFNSTSTEKIREFGIDALDFIEDNRDFISAEIADSFSLPKSSHPLNRDGEGLQTSNSMDNEAFTKFKSSNQDTHRPSCINIACSDDKNILGQVHHQLARLHSTGRFLQGDQSIDWNSVIFHESAAASMGIYEAIIDLANLFLNLSNEGIFTDCNIKFEDEQHKRMGLDLMFKAGSKGNLSATLFLANAYYHGDNTKGINLEPDWKEAVFWFERAIELKEEERQEESSLLHYNLTMPCPLYSIYEKLGEMYSRGKNNLAKDLEKAYQYYELAAEKATESHNGKMAMKFYEIMEAMDTEE